MPLARPLVAGQMSQLDDQFDLDIRLTPLRRSPAEELRQVAGTGGWECYSVDASCGATCACDTSETCNQQLEECGFPFTFPGNYCEDQSDGCGPGGGGGGGDVDDGQTGTCECPTSAGCPATPAC